MKLTIEETKRLIEMFRSEDEGNGLIACEALRNYVSMENKVRLVFIYHYGQYIMRNWKDNYKEFHDFMEKIIVPEIAKDTDVHSCETYPFIKKYGTQEDLNFWAEQYGTDLLDALTEHLNLPKEVTFKIGVPQTLPKENA
jgi:hypothetical protein